MISDATRSVRTEQRTTRNRSCACPDNLSSGEVRCSRTTYFTPRQLGWVGVTTDVWHLRPRCILYPRKRPVNERLTNSDAMVARAEEVAICCKRREGSKSSSVSPEDSGGSVSHSCQSRESWHRNNCHQDDGTSVPMSSAYSPLLHLPRPSLRGAVCARSARLRGSGRLGQMNVVGRGPPGDKALCTGTLR